MPQSPDAVRLAQTIKDLWYRDAGHEHDGYPHLVVTLGDGRTGELLEVGYEADDNVLVLHVEEDVTVADADDTDADDTDDGTYRDHLRASDITPTSVIETRLVEADLGRRYRDPAYQLDAVSARGIVDRLTPHRVRVLYRRPRPEVCSLASAPWVVTQVIVIGRPVLALLRHEYDGHLLPPERQRTFTDLDVAPRWVGDVVRALAHEEVT